MTANRASPAALYARLLGPAWADLAPGVRDMHSTFAPARIAGAFRVQTGGGRIARLLVWLFRLPRAGDEVPVELVVTAGERAQLWRRRFGQRRFQSTQRERSGGLLAECFGPLELRLRPRVERGALLLDPAGAGLLLGPLYVPLPRALAPRVTATEAAQDGTGRIRVAVAVALPLAGLLISYEGDVAREGIG